MSLASTIRNNNYNISQSEAKEFITNFQAALPSLMSGGMQGQAVFPISEAFSKEALLGLLNQNKCIGARAYLALNSEQKFCLVFCGVDDNGNDYNLAIGTNLPSVLIENGISCPMNCPEASKING